ncbi:hypothetical protein [Arthrobacter sp. NPDC058127]|uniref:hypothetical protein n=1 Tax=Arthrobacter sp. NPDC058127 TaxID=3346351 RepID=UPI0036E7D993
MFNQFTSKVNGGTTTTFTYAGPRNDIRLTAGGTSFLNGTLGITQQSSGGATTSFIRDPGGNLISMRTSSGASFSYKAASLPSYCQDQRPGFPHPSCAGSQERTRPAGKPGTGQRRSPRLL